MTLYQCPLCGRQGFTRVGLTRHYCPATEIIDTTAENWSPLQRRRRLRPEEIARAKPVVEGYGSTESRPNRDGSTESRPTKAAEGGVA